MTTAWKPIETLPPDTGALLYGPYTSVGGEGPAMGVGRYKIVKWVREEVESVSSGKSGLKRKIVQEVVDEEKEWSPEAPSCATHWQPLPDPPAEGT